MTRYLLSSHDGFGLGHVRRNLRIASAIVDADPTADVTVATGVAVDLPWPIGRGIKLASLVPLIKDGDGAYRNPNMTFEAALDVRRRSFLDLVERESPRVVLIDRHPYGVGGEFRDGLVAARSAGAAALLGLRDILDEPDPIRAEVAGAGWDRVDELFDEALVYGSPVLCDQREEYGIPLPLRYCGWVASDTRPRPAAVIPRTLLVTAGGGGDGEALLRLTCGVLERAQDWSATLIAGPYAADSAPCGTSVADRLHRLRTVDGYERFHRRSAAVMQMAGYNATAEAIAAGVKPILVPRRSPRREQAIRASRLAALGLADVVDQGADPSEVVWLLGRDRRLAPGAPGTAGLSLDGATVAAQRLVAAALEVAR